MTDPISGDAVRRVGEAASKAASQQETPLKDGGAKFEQAFDKGVGDLDAVKNALNTDVRTQVQQVPDAKKVELTREFDSKVAPLERSDQVRYFSVRIRSAHETLIQLERSSAGVESGPWKDKLADRLGEFQDQYSELDGFLRAFSSGQEFTQPELLSVQIRMHQVTQSMELLSKTVEQSVSGMKTIFQTNV
jgi:hypothetical protein